jgi:riboflavin biosynthesis pyrimidine reductase
MNTMPKIVVSSTLTSSNWAPTTILAGADGLAEHTQRSHERVLVLGRPRLTGSLIQHGLLDELRIMISPIAIGSGQPISAGLGGVVHLQLGRVRPFASGNVLLTYRPATKRGQLTSLPNTRTVFRPVTPRPTA